jgi:hypothetical protein
MQLTIAILACAGLAVANTAFERAIIPGGEYGRFGERVKLAPVAAPSSTILSNAVAPIKFDFAGNAATTGLVGGSFVPLALCIFIV